MQSKLDTRNEVLCQGFPQELATYMNYCRALRFEERPDYAYLKRMLKDLFFRENYQYDFIYDWTILNFNKNNRNEERKKERESHVEDVKAPEPRAGEEVRPRQRHL